LMMFFLSLLVPVVVVTTPDLPPFEPPFFGDFVSDRFHFSFGIPRRIPFPFLQHHPKILDMFDVDLFVKGNTTSTRSSLPPR